MLKKVKSYCENESISCYFVVVFKKRIFTIGLIKEK